MSKKRAIKVYVSDELHECIRGLSEDIDVSMSQIFVSALLDYLQRAVEEVKSAH